MHRRLPDEKVVLKPIGEVETTGKDEALTIALNTLKEIAQGKPDVPFSEAYPVDHRLKAADLLLSYALNPDDKETDGANENSK